MKKLLCYLKNYRMEALLAPLFKLLEAGFELLVPLVVSGMIDTGIAGNDRNYLYSRGLVLILFAAVGLVSAVTAQYFSAKAAVGFGTAMRDDLFRHILSLSAAETDTAGKATLITRMTNDSNQIQNGVNMFFRLVLRSPFIVFGAMVMAYRIKGSEGLLFTGVIAALFFIVFLIMRVSVKGYRLVQKKLDTVLTKTSENLTGVRVIRAFNREEAEKKSCADAAGALAGEQIKVGKISALMNPVTYVCINLGVIAVLKTGAVNVSAGSLTQGQVVALVSYMSQILVELVKLANLIILLSKSEASAKRINEIFALKSSLKDGTADAGSVIPSVEFENVGFTYPGASEEAVSDISFRAEPGQTIGVIGGTGSGKTTVMDLIPRFYDAGRGRILIGGRDIREYHIRSLRDAVGIVEQKTFLFGGTIEGNLLWGKKDATPDELSEAVKTAQAQNVISGKSGNMEAEVEQEGRNFSGGQKQRLSLARTFAKDPKILILDDSSSALDFATDASLRKAIAEKYAASTVFMVSQRVTSIRHADRILVLDDGKMVGNGTHEELLKNCGVYREICLSQLSEEEVKKA